MLSGKSALPKNNIIFSVANTGKPLPEDLLQWINNVKTNTDLLNERPAKLGLGLLIVQKILLLHDSSLHAYTQEGARNIFTFPMPIYTLSASN